MGGSGYGLGFIWCQSLTTRRGVAGGDWRGTMNVEERDLMILCLRIILLKVIMLCFLNYVLLFMFYKRLDAI